ncbi:MAG: adenylyltransferase/cytidyltransferase family protein [Bacteroidales bacterium]
MIVHYGLEEPVDIGRSVVTTGTFDGVHIGHQVIISRINELAREVDGESVLITFHPHPRKVLYPDTLGKEIRMINTQREKIAMLETTGLDHLIIMPFTKEFAHTSSESFIRDILHKKLHIRKSVVGFNHFFGFNKEGNYNQLAALGEELNFEVEEIPEQDIQNETVSSTKIRKAITEGNIQRANAYLNHILMMMGELSVNDDHQLLPGDINSWVVSAEEPEKLLPPSGIYAVRIRQGEQNLKAIGVRNDEIHGEGSMLIIPVEAGQPVTGRIATILFYKQLINGLQTRGNQYAGQVRLAVEEADELIY